MSTSILYIGNKLAVSGKSPTTIDTLGKKFEEMGFKMCYSSSYLNKGVRLIHMIYSTIKLRNKVDFVCIDTYSNQAFYFTYIVAKLCRFFNIKYIPFLHGGRLPDRLNDSPKMCKYIFENSYNNISPSSYLFEAFRSHGFPSLLIPNSIPLKEYSYKQRSELSCRLLYVRHLASIYNPQMAVRLVSLLKENHPDVHLNIVGEDKDGSLQDCILLAESLSVTNNITFSGRLSKKDWHKLSQDYDIFINTTNFDNMPVSVIEGMALGMPIVSTNVGGLSYLIDDGKDGFLVNENDDKQMANIINGILSNPQKAIDCSKKARLKVEQFDWEEVKKQWFNVFSS
ncbi:glycosyltransferase family 4 protein [Saccharicrinis aurantiacus]|uniref:glycosyltransferase family 4 protein n=1 Tax=Saccharicrinis aurantiacus TaxID=1849719 RepID=UPI0008391AF7|nr:glycosyltransferase family 4 protein [Saccharicrinis aurantiacus]